MRILHVVHGLARGGLENGVVNLLNHLPYPEFEQAVCCLDHRGEMADRVLPRVPIYVLGRTRHDLTAPWRLARVIREYQPDLVHSRNWNAWPDTVLANVIARNRGPLVWSFHGFAAGDSAPLRRRAASFVLSTLTDHLAAVCCDTAGRFAKWAGIRSSRFKILYNGVDTQRFAPAGDRSQSRAALDLPERHLIVLTVASLTRIKDHASMVSAAAKVCAHRRTPLLFLFVGEGTLRAQLQGQVESLGLTNRVHLLGDTDNVVEYLRTADIFVLPSRLEGMSNAILEAMACGLPVIARRVGGNPELVAHEQTGLLCDANDIDSLADAISRLIDDAGLRARLGSAARERTVSAWSLEAMLARYEDFYRSVVSGGIHERRVQ